MSSRDTVAEGSGLTIDTADHDDIHEGQWRAFVRITIGGVDPAGVIGGSIHVDLPVAYGDPAGAA